MPARNETRSDSTLKTQVQAMDEPTLVDDRLNEHAGQFQEFLEDTSKATFNYLDEIDKMLRWDKTRLVVNIDDLRDYTPESRALADG